MREESVDKRPTNAEACADLSELWLREGEYAFVNDDQRAPTAPSYTWTETPSLARPMAQVKPQTPPPTTATVKFLEDDMLML